MADISFAFPSSLSAELEGLLLYMGYASLIRVVLTPISPIQEKDHSLLSAVTSLNLGFSQQFMFYPTELPSVHILIHSLGFFKFPKVNCYFSLPQGFTL